MINYTTMGDYLRERYLKDVEFYSHNNKTLQRSASTTSLIADASTKTAKITNPEDVKDLFHISMDLLTFKNNAIHVCKYMLQSFEGQIESFFNTPEEAILHIQSLDEVWRTHWKEHFLFLEHELGELNKKFIDSYRNKQNQDNMNDIDECIHMIEPDLSSTDDEWLIEIPASRLQEMKNLLEINTSSEQDENGLSIEKKQNGSAVNMNLNGNACTIKDSSPSKSTKDKMTEQMNIAVLDEIPDNDSLSSCDISLNISRPGTPIIPKSSVIRISYTDDQAKKHYINKYYVQDDELYVRIPMKEKLLTDEYSSKKRKVVSTSEDSSTSCSESISSGLAELLGIKKKKRRRIKSISTTTSSLSTTSKTDSIHSYHSDDNSETQSSHTQSSDENIQNVLDQIPDCSDSDSSSCVCLDDVYSDVDTQELKGKPKYNKMKPERTSRRATWMNDPLLKPMMFKMYELSSEEEDNIEDKMEDVKEDYKEKPCLSTSSEEDNKSIKPVYINDSDSSSDVEFVSSMHQQTPPAEGDSTIKGRRNIKKILTEAELSKETKKVQELERERVERLMKNAQTKPQKDDFVLNSNEDDNLHVTVHPKLAGKLLAHQRKGVQFLWDNCYESVQRLQNGDEGSGCILAHCMGLGKTFQVVTFVHTLFSHPVTDLKRVLILSPLSIVENWQREFEEAAKLIAEPQEINIFLGGTARDSTTVKISTVHRWHIVGGVLIISYDSFMALVKRDERAIDKWLLDPGADLVVCDEGHLLKKPTARRTIAIGMVATKRRIILTGTPMQNHLDDYFCIVGLVKPNFFGTEREYRNRFVNPIQNGQFVNSEPHDIKLMKKRSHVLHKMTRHFIQRYEEKELLPYLPTKLDYAIKIEMTDKQIELIREFLKICNFTNLFSNVAVLRGIFSHPYLLQMQAMALEKNKYKKKPVTVGAGDEEIIIPEVIKGDWFKLPEDAATNINYGPKLQVMMSIIKETMARNEKILVFSVSLLELDLIEKFLGMDPTWVRGRSYVRIDGFVDVNHRARYCKQFNNPTSGLNLMLLTQRVGGLGLNLFAANRAILMNISWNPADDTQSLFRIYRLGQLKTCYVYRLIAMGTTEEVIYERSITKQAIASRVIDEKHIMRHFQASQLAAMYRCDLDKSGERRLPKPPSDTLLGSVLTKHQCIYTYHDHNAMLENLPDEELDEIEMKLAWEEYEKEKDNIYPTLSSSYVPLYADLAAGPSNRGVQSNAEESKAIPATIDTLKNKTIYFECNSYTKGGKILAVFNERGKITNNLDDLTNAQIRTAVRLCTMQPHIFNSNSYVIERNGMFFDRDRENTIPQRNRNINEPEI